MAPLRPLFDNNWLFGRLVGLKLFRDFLIGRDTFAVPRRPSLFHRIRQGCFFEDNLVNRLLVNRVVDIVELLLAPVREREGHKADRAGDLMLPTTRAEDLFRQGIASLRLCFLVLMRQQLKGIARRVL